MAVSSTIKIRKLNLKNEFKCYLIHILVYYFSWNRLRFFLKPCSVSVNFPDPIYMSINVRYIEFVF